MRPASSTRRAVKGGTTLVYGFDPGHDRIATPPAYQDTRSGVATSIPHPGHALDTDHDGVLDADDRCVHQSLFH